MLRLWLLAYDDKEGKNMKGTLFEKKIDVTRGLEQGEIMDYIMCFGDVELAVGNVKKRLIDSLGIYNLDNTKTYQNAMREIIETIFKEEFGFT